jgi:GNAT superfamily N-acetyltransferase
VELRRAVPADAAAIADVFVAARAGMTYLPPLDVQDARRFLVEEVAAKLEVSVVEDAGAVVAFSALDGDNLAFLYVAPEAQGRGAGTLLFERVTELRPAGFELWVFQRNTGARRFYERHGCVLVLETDGSGNMEREPDARYAWRA